MIWYMASKIWYKPTAYDKTEKDWQERVKSQNTETARQEEKSVNLQKRVYKLGTHEGDNEG